MSVSEVLDSLEPNFRIKVRELLRICQQEGVLIYPYCGLRTCLEQAVVFRKTRSTKEIQQASQSLRDRGFPFLADVLLNCPPQKGQKPDLTKAAPGESWHQYGLALDCAPSVGGKLLWNDDAPEWQIYGSAARHVGLEWAGDWKSFPEFPHVQMPSPARNPLSVHSPAQAEALLKKVGSL